MGDDGRPDFIPPAYLDPNAAYLAGRTKMRIAGSSWYRRCA
jgi:hypothetical protein